VSDLWEWINEVLRWNLIWRRKRFAWEVDMERQLYILIADEKEKD